MDRRTDSIPPQRLLTELNALYLAYFGRPADAEGIRYYLAQPATNLQLLVGCFSASPEAQRLYGDGPVDAQIDAIYRSLFQRGAEAEGLAYWGAQVARGALSPAEVAWAILTGARNDDRTAVQNKLQAVAEFQGALETAQLADGYAGDAAAAAARAWLAGITAAPDSLANARAALPQAVQSATAPRPMAPILPSPRPDDGRVADGPSAPPAEPGPSHPAAPAPSEPPAGEPPPVLAATIDAEGRVRLQHAGPAVVASRQGDTWHFSSGSQEATLAATVRGFETAAGTRLWLTSTLAHGLEFSGDGEACVNAPAEGADLATSFRATGPHALVLAAGSDYLLTAQQAASARLDAEGTAGALAGTGHLGVVDAPSALADGVAAQLKAAGIDEITARLTITAPNPPITSLAGMDGLDALWNQGSTRYFLVTEVPGLLRIAMTQVATESWTVRYAAGALAGTGATQSVHLAEVGSVSRSPTLFLGAHGGDVITALAIHSTGRANWVRLSTDGGMDAGVELKSLTVTGDQRLHLTVDGSLVETTWLARIDASGARGGLVFDASGATGRLVVAGSAGDDVLGLQLARQGAVLLQAGEGDDVVTLDQDAAFADTGVLQADDRIDGGAGSDSLRLRAATAVALQEDADRAVLTGFERLRIVDNLGGRSLDVSRFGVNHLELELPVTGSEAIVTGLRPGAVVETVGGWSSNQVLRIGVDGATAPDRTDDHLLLHLNVELNAGSRRHTSVALEGVERLEVRTGDRDPVFNPTGIQDGYGLGLQDGSEASLRLITLTGDRSLNFWGSHTLQALQRIDASALRGQLQITFQSVSITGGLDITGSATAANQLDGSAGGDRLAGGAADDQLLGHAGDDWLAGGDGDDRLDGGSGRDTMTGGSGRDAFGLSGASDDGAESDVVTDLDFTADTLVLADGGALPLGVRNLVDALDGSGTLAAAADAAAAAIGGWHAGTFAWDGGRYLLVERGGNGTYDAGDVLVRIDGATGTLDSLARFASRVLLADTGGHDHYSGTGGDDEIVGGAGADTLYGLGGNDRLVAGEGHDLVDGGAGDDLVVLLETTPAADTVRHGGAADGVDTLVGFAFGVGGADLFDFRGNLANGSTGSTSALAQHVPVQVADGGSATANGVLFAFTGAGDQLASGTTAATAVAHAVAALTSGGDFSAANIGSGDRLLLMLDDGTDSFLFHYVAAGDFSVTTAADLTLIGVFQGAQAGLLATGDII